MLLNKSLEKDHKIPRLAIVGVTHLSDLYPNVKYKIRLMTDLREYEARPFIHDLGEGSFYESAATKNPFRKFLNILRICWGHLRVLIFLAIERSTVVYVCYPGIFILNLLTLFPEKVRPKIILDAFISIYDTAINDRRMFAPEDWRAQLLFWLERRAFTTADVVITDTLENSCFFAKQFTLPTEKFTDIPLCIPPLKKSSAAQSTRYFTCLFVGSLVPLQGIQTVLEAANELQGMTDIKFKIIGDGQDAMVIKSFLADRPLPSLTWERGFYPTHYINDQILQADLCLGIFGSTEKAMRVFPYKLYYYSRAGKAFVTRKTPCAERLCQHLDQNFILVDINNNQSLGETIKTLYENSIHLKDLGKASKELFEEQLGDTNIRRKLQVLLASTASRGQ